MTTTRDETPDALYTALAWVAIVIATLCVLSGALSPEGSPMRVFFVVPLALCWLPAFTRGLVRGRRR